MKYTVSINEAKRSITVTLADGTKGTARCCPTDHFNINTGIELALERAKVAKANAEKAKAEKAKEVKPSPMATQMTVTMLAKQLEKVLPNGQIIVAVGGGDHCLTEQGREWLASIAGVSAKCGCPCCNCNKDGAYDVDTYNEDAYDDGYSDGYSEGYADAKAEYETDNEAYDKGYDDGYENGYDEGYYDGHDEAEAECDDYEEYYDAMQRIIAIIDDIETID